MSENMQKQPLFDPESGLPLKIDGKEVYRFLTAQFLHQNQLSWSRLQTQFAVEAGILAWFFSHGRCESICIATIGMLLGTAAVFFLYMLVLRDWEIRDQYRDDLNLFNQKLGISKIITDPKLGWRTGRNIAKILTYGCIITNIALLVHQLC